MSGKEQLFGRNMGFVPDTHWVQNTVTPIVEPKGLNNQRADTQSVARISKQFVIYRTYNDLVIHSASSFKLVTLNSVVYKSTL